MNSISVSSAAALSRLKLFLALSRTPHGLLDLATPALGAILWLGGFPTLQVMVLGLGTAFAGYTAVYALNDLVDNQIDREIIQDSGRAGGGGDLDVVFVRHPIAQGLMTFQEGFWWVVFWALLALIGAYWLNPVCALIFIIGFVLEAIYCLLSSVSHLRTLVSGVVKTSGGIAAAFAVAPDPSPVFLIVLFSWLFFWEIGGQNVPNDWHDLEEDNCLRIKTVPARYGLKGAGLIILGSLAISITLSIALFSIAPLELSLPFLGASLFVGVYLLLLPAFRLYRTRSQTQASVLFNKASYYPLALLVIVLLRLIT